MKYLKISFAKPMVTVVLLMFSNSCEEPNVNPTCTASASVLAGIAPLEVLFSGKGIDEDGKVVLYEWDFQGDGVFDFSSPSSASTSFVFEAGSFIPTLRVTDDVGGTGTSSLNISVIANQLPTASASATPSTGVAPLVVSFSGSGSDPDGTIVKYQWDFQGDGSFDFSSATTATTTFTYTNTGTYTATLQVTDDKGGTDTSTKQITIKDFKYPGFKDLSFFVGGFWKYKWTYDDEANGTKKPQKTGFTTITLVDKVVVNFTGLGDLTLYKTEYVGSGTTYPLTWAARPYLAVKDGVIYMAQIKNGQWGAAILLSGQTGEFYGDQGFVGYFSPSRQESVTSSFITDEFNSAYSTNGVVVSEPFYKPSCETIAGVKICDDQFHDYQVKEYYINGVGFGGFYRSGSSVFSGGGYIDIFKSTMKVWLVDTNIKK